ncbi:hypothetical protein GQR58_025693 [Nymphon striatum]|nr:hypothetical protein GQR58_025693 [Nymphon striatum]
MRLLYLRQLKVLKQEVNQCGNAFLYQNMVQSHWNCLVPEATIPSGVYHRTYNHCITRLVTFPDTNVQELKSLKPLQINRFNGGPFGYNGGNNFGNVYGNGNANGNANNYNYGSQFGNGNNNNNYGPGNENNRQTRQNGNQNEEDCKYQCMSTLGCFSSWFDSKSVTRTCHLSGHRLGPLKAQGSLSGNYEKSNYTEPFCLQSVCSPNEIETILKYEKTKIHDYFIMDRLPGVQSEGECKLKCTTAPFRCPYFDYNEKTKLCSLGFPNMYSEYSDLLTDQDYSHQQLRCVDSDIRLAAHFHQRLSYIEERQSEAIRDLALHQDKDKDVLRKL